MRKYLIAAAVVAVAMFCFFAERQIFIFRMSDLAQRRFDALSHALQRLDNEVDEKNRNGDFFRFMGVRAESNEDAQELNTLPDLIESAVVLDNKLQTRARSGRDLSSEESTRLRSVEVKNLLTEHAFLRRYILTDFAGKKTGSLVFILRPDLKNAFATLFAANFDFSVVAAFSRDSFNRDEKKYISVLLYGQTAPTDTLTIRGTQFISVRQTSLEENVILFQVVPLPPFWQFFSLYLAGTVFVGVFAFLVHAHATNRQTRREMSERILGGYKKAIDERTAAVQQLAALGSNETLKEKLVEADVREEDIEARLAAARSEAQGAAAQEKSKIVIEMMPENRQFRFMNPAVVLREAAARKPVFTPEEQKLRERAFSDELKGLMGALAVPAEGIPVVPVDDGNLIREISAFEEKYRFPDIDQYLYYLNELYFDEVTESELGEAMRVAGETVQSQEFAILLYDSRRAVFKTGFVHGISDALKQTFYLLPKDSVLPNDFSDYGYVEVKQSLKQNPYFRKRFPAGFTDELKGIHIFNITETFLRARIIFFDKQRGGGLTDVESIATIRSYLRQIAPAIHMFFLETTETGGGNPRDLANWAVQELKECISLSEGAMPVISQYVFESSLPLDMLLSLTRATTAELTGGEKILLVSPSHIVIAHAAQKGKALEEIVSAGGGGRRFIIKDGEFGKTTRNLYTFIEF